MWFGVQAACGRVKPRSRLWTLRLDKVRGCSVSMSACGGGCICVCWSSGGADKWVPQRGCGDPRGQICGSTRLHIALHAGCETQHPCFTLERDSVGEKQAVS